jgi:pimeloyl-ACP methyl ester carboxylesterase
MYPESLACLPAVLEVVRQRVDDRPVALYGLSLGANFALAAVAGAPWLKALALFGPPLGLAITNRHRLLEIVGTFHPLALPATIDAPSGHFVRSCLVPVRFHGNVRHTNSEPEFATHLNALILQLDPLRSAAAMPPIPTLILGGDMDVLAPPADLERLKSTIAGPCELRVFLYRNHTTLLYDRKASEWTADWLAARL